MTICGSTPICYSAPMIKRVILACRRGPRRRSDRAMRRVMAMPLPYPCTSGRAAGGLSLPTLESLGFGHVTTIQGVRSMAQPIGCFGRLGSRARASILLSAIGRLPDVFRKTKGATFPDGIFVGGQGRARRGIRTQNPRRPRRVCRGSAKELGACTSLGGCADCLDRRSSDLSCGRA